MARIVLPKEFVCKIGKVSPHLDRTLALLHSRSCASRSFPVNCWPSDNGEGGCDVNIEYELEAQQLELQDVAIVIPLP